MRLVILAFALATTLGCAKKQAAAPAAKTTPSNTESAAPAGGAPDSTTPAKTEGDSGSRGPVKKGGDPCEGGQ